MINCATYPSLKNKIVLISGGASGIGESIVEHFCNQQAKVIFLDINDNAAEKVIDYNRRNYNNAPIYKNCDLNNIKELQKTINTIGKEIGNISILINNAANDERHSMNDVTEEFWNDRININLKHYFFAAKECSKMMMKNNKGVIVNIGSFSWMLNIGGMICYTTAKSAISGLTRSLARELGNYNIRVNCVVPGWIMTERQKKLWLTPEIEKNTLDRQCIKRLL